MADVTQTTENWKARVFGAWVVFPIRVEQPRKNMFNVVYHREGNAIEETMALAQWKSLKPYKVTT